MTSHLPPLDNEQRELFHAIFNEWFAGASETDYAMLEAARERVAPGQICSMVSLVRGCFARPDLMAELPESLVQLFRARNWPQADAASKAA